MAKRCSLFALIEWWVRRSFSRTGLEAGKFDLGDSTVMHCWSPKNHDPSKPNLLLLHGMGPGGMWQWQGKLSFAKHYNLYVPDLVFFGDSYTSRSDRSEEFQARCVAALMDVIGVSRMSVIGFSYGGFVAYSLAAQFPEMVERVAISGAGVSMEDEDMAEGFFKVGTMDEAVELLFPTSWKQMDDLTKLFLHKPPKFSIPLPSCILQDFMDEFVMKNMKEQKELVIALLGNRSLSNLPKITQPILIVWGEYDQIFPVELAHRLKRHLKGNEKVDVVIIKNSGHLPQGEKPKETWKCLRAFLTNRHPGTEPRISLKAE